MPNPSLDWPNDLPDLRVTAVTRVTPQKSATNPVTQADDGKVTRVTEGAAVTFVTGANDSRVTLKPAEILAVTPVTLVTPKTDGVPEELRAGLDRLRDMRRPRVQRPELWDEITRDALEIATDGWAAQAIALGWEPLQIFGYQPSSDPDDFGLAVELAGRTIVAVDERCFYLRKDGVRSFFDNRPRPALTKFLWELGN
jgi:hypothetical protein